MCFRTKNAVDFETKKNECVERGEEMLSEDRPAISYRSRKDSVLFTQSFLTRMRPSHLTKDSTTPIGKELIHLRLRRVGSHEGCGFLRCMSLFVPVELPTEVVRTLRLFRYVPELFVGS